ncbi:hypothetical protein [Promicromonospora soli]|nr:hypothetical protein [Promicromonospora soli]
MRAEPAHDVLPRDVLARDGPARDLPAHPIDHSTTEEKDGR